MNRGQKKVPGRVLCQGPEVSRVTRQRASDINTRANLFGRNLRSYYCGEDDSIKQERPTGVPTRPL
jgi:hypothetical protein